MFKNASILSPFVLLAEELVSDGQIYHLHLHCNSPVHLIME